MNKTYIIELFDQGKKISEIAKEVNLTPQRINQILKELGKKQENFNYSPKITDDIKTLILSLHNESKTAAEIARAVDLTPTSIRSFFKRNSIKPNIKVADRSRPCVICGISFVPPYSDGVKKDKYKTCSESCLSRHLSNMKIKYNSDDINKVIEFKNNKITNSEIVALIGVDINKIKEIIKKNELYLTPEEAGKNAYQAKLNKNPNCMQEMRECHMELSQKEFEERILLLEKEVLDKKGTISGLANRFGLIAASVVEYLKRNNKEYLLEIKDSTPQRDIAEFLKKYFKEDEIIYNTRKIISPLELDVYLPSLKLAIEYCGFYWHSENKKDRGYHYNKMKKCQEKGIRLITIFEDEWLEREDQVKNFLLSVVGKNSIKIDARKTEVKQINKEEADLFLEQNHIQGSSMTEAAFGLYNNNDLIAVITGGKHHRQGHENTFVLNRLAFKNNVNIRGGSSKLLKALINYAKANNYSRLISWSDNRWSEGNVYEKIGFILDQEIGPDYSYVKGLKRISKQSSKKSNLTKIGGVGNTELEMANSLGYYRIWDCGKKRWILNLVP